MMNINDIAKLTGYSAETLKSLINSGKLPIAVVASNGSRNNYYVLPPKVYEYFGLKIDGYEPPPTININYDKLVGDVAKRLVTGVSWNE